jgi:hypothetical protein
MVSGESLRVDQFHKDKITRILKIMQENLTKNGAGSGIRKKFIPDPNPGGKKALDPGSATLIRRVRYIYMIINNEFSKTSASR